MFRNPIIDAAVVLIVVLLIFGPKRLPMLGRSLGHGMREFKDSISGHSKLDEDEERPALTESQSAPATGSTRAAEASPAPDPKSAAAPSTAAQAASERESAEVGSREARS